MQPDDRAPESAASAASPAPSDSSASAQADLAAWLLAEDDPYVAQEPAPAAVPAAAAAPAATAAGWSVVGSAFAPLPGRPLLSALPSGTPACGAVMSAEVGTTVHGVYEGLVELARQGERARLTLRTGMGDLAYGGSAVVAWTVGHGDRVPAGAALGVVTGSDSSGHPQLVLTLSARDIAAPDSAPPDGVRWLAELADPAELGLRADGAGIGVDPFRTDLRLAGHLGGAGGAP